jgi:YVTN family beta-propeller protein
MKVFLLLCAIAVLAAGCGSAGHKAGSTSTTQPVSQTTHSHRAVPVTVAEHALGTLAAPVQDATSAPWQTGALLAGGLTAADTSTSNVVPVRTPGTLPPLPLALHDATSAALGRSVYLFGGGDGVRQLDGIIRVAPGTPTTVGHLPAPSSDQAGAPWNGSEYVVGGYTGTRWLNTIVRWRPGAQPRVVGHLPVALRYAAVAAVAGRIVIAGGSTPAGTASDAVLSFDPATGRVTRIGRLPNPTTHAAAAALGSHVYVIGGRSATVDTPTAAIEAVDPIARKVVPAGTLNSARSDLAAIGLPGKILLAGGRGASGTIATISELTPTTRAVSSVPKLVNAHNVYAADTPNDLTGAARTALPRIYVPNSKSDTVDVIDPKTYKIVDHFAVGGLPQHVVPSYDLKHLYVTNDTGNTLTEINPQTGKPTRTIPVEDPYNMYFTPDGRYAIVVAERNQRLDFRDAHTFALVKSVPTPCAGVDHMDFTADGTKALVSCEFSGQLLEVDIPSQRVVKTIDVGGGGMPQDVKLSPDGRVFYVADMMTNGIWVVGAQSFKVLSVIHTGAGAHGLYPSRNSKYLYITNRGEGSISVLDFSTRKLVHKWWIPGGGSPDMGGVSANGKVLWVSGRYNGVVYAISTRDGKLLARIPVGSGPHGLCVWPQPGRYSLGHTGILR